MTLLLLARSDQWRGWESLEAAANLVDLAAVVYGMIAVLVERGFNMVFWALEQRKKRIEERKAEGRAEERARILREAKEKGIDVSELIPERKDSE